MNSEYWFGDLAQSLKNGFFSDSVVLELARVSHDQAITGDQTQLFQRASEILQLAAEGNRWIDNPQMSERTSRCASFFGQAVDALSFVLTSEAFAKEIQKLTQTADQLAAGQIPSQDSIERLRTFFFNAGRSELERTEWLLNGEREIDRLKWLAAK